jgi:predicted DNA-binding transcriptional regulator AlpA
MNLQNQLTNETATVDTDVARSDREPLSTDAHTTSGVRFLTKDQVLTLLGVSNTTLWELTVKADFPRARVLHSEASSASCRSYFMAHEVEAWMLSRPKRVLKSDRPQGDAR